MLMDQKLIETVLSYNLMILILLKLSLVLQFTNFIKMYSWSITCTFIDTYDIKCWFGFTIKSH